MLSTAASGVQSIIYELTQSVSCVVGSRHAVDFLQGRLTPPASLTSLVDMLLKVEITH